MAAVGLVGVLEQITVEKSRRRMINGRISPVEDDEGDVFYLISRPPERSSEGKEEGG